MKAFWWFKENVIAGMARPGFNSTRWFEFPFEEGLVLGWLGRFRSGSIDLESFRQHVRDYGPRIVGFYNLNGRSPDDLLRRMEEPEAILQTMRSIGTRSNLLLDCEVTESHLKFEFNDTRLNWEISRLKNHGIARIVSLTEDPICENDLREHFQTVHLSIPDLGAPSIDQVHRLADIIVDAERAGEKLAVHCLAGIGRTSTMLISAHLALGDDLTDLKNLIARQNPSFIFAGQQGAFIESVARHYLATRGTK